MAATFSMNGRDLQRSNGVCVLAENIRKQRPHCHARHLGIKDRVMPAQLMFSRTQTSLCSSLFVHAVSDAPCIQLATAKLPQQVDEEKFATNLYQWAATLTSSGQNLPFTLPLSVKKLKDGFQMSLLRINNGEPVAVGHIHAEVEQEPSVGNILFVRFYEGEGSQLVRSSPLPNDPQQRLKLIVDGLLDISTIMKTMQTAIKQTAGRSLRPKGA